MTIDATLAAAMLRGTATVPEKLIGCWERRHIRFFNGAEDTTTRVIWLQTASGVGRHSGKRDAAQLARAGRPR